MKDNLHEEILRQLSLINFDTSKTLFEQSEDDPLYFASTAEKEKEYKKYSKSSKDWLCQGLMPFTYKGLGGKRSIVAVLKNPCFKTQYIDKQQTEKKSKVLFDILVDNINEYFGSNDAILWTLKNIDNNATYYSLLKRIRALGSYTGVLPPGLRVLQEKGGLSLKYEYILDWIQLNGYLGINFYYQEREKRYLKYFVQILEKWGENPKNMWIRFDSVTESKPMSPEDVGKFYKKYKSFPSIIQIIDPSPSKIIEVAHFVLPMASMFLNFFGGLPGIIIGSILELIDSSIYLSYDEDPYMFGLGIIFAIVPLGALRKVPGYAEMTEEGVELAFKNLGKKIKNGEKLTTYERIFLKNLVKNPIVQKNAVMTVIGKGLVHLAKKQSPSTVLRFVNWLYEKGYLLSRGYYTIANMILATQTFDYYASITWGKCSGTFQLIPTIIDLISLLFEQNGKIENWNPNSIKEKLKKNLDFAQPFTESETECLLLAQYNLMKIIKNYKLKMYSVYKIAIDDIIQQNIKYSVNGHYSLRLARIQNFLYNCWQQNKFFIDEENIVYEFSNKKLIFFNAKKIKKVSIFTPFGETVEIISNTTKNNQIISKTIDKTELLVFNAELYNGKSFGGKIFPGVKAQYNSGSSLKSPQLNFGYFDDEFISMLRAYQEYKKIPINGMLDIKTLYTIKYDIDSKRCGDEIENQTNLELTLEEEKELINQDINIIVEKLKENQEMAKSTPSQPNKLTTENQKKLEEKIKFYTNTKFSESDTIKIINELNFELKH